MSGGSQHNPNGRQAQLGAGWSPLQVANFLARAPQAHMAERGHTWHTPTPPPHLYHVPAPSPPDPLQALLLQAMKATGNSVFRHTATPPEMYRHTPTPPDKHLMSGMREEDRGKPMKASGNSVFRHTATPPEMYRHTPTPPDKHLMRHTPSPGDVKVGAAMPPAEMYPHLGPGRDKLVRPEDLLYARGVDLSVSSARGANGAPGSAPAHPPHPSPALSVRDAPTINSLIARAQPRPGHARVDALLERLSAPASPHSVIVHPRAAPTPSPPSSNEDSADSCGAPPGSKRKRKPERTVRVPAPTGPPPAHTQPPTPPPAHHTPPPLPSNVALLGAQPMENGDHNGPEIKEETEEPEADTKPTDMEIEDTQIPQQKPPSPEPHARRKEKTRSNSSETIDDIAAMVACEKLLQPPVDKPAPDEETPETIDQLKSVLASPVKETKVDKVEEPKMSPPRTQEKEKEADKPPEPAVEAAAAPRRRSARTSNTESTNVPVESPSEAKPASPLSDAGRSAEPTASSFVEVENQLEKMFAGIEEQAPTESNQTEKPNKPKKRRKSAPTKGENKPGRRTARAITTDRRKPGRKKGGKGDKKEQAVKDAYDSGSNASSGRSRGPYIQIRGPRDSPLSVAVINAATGDDDAEASKLGARRKPADYRNGLRARGLHASTLGLRYDATTPDLTWTCAFCETGPHASGLGDLFGPYTVETDCEEYRALDEATRQRYEALPSPNEVWFHEACAVWAPGLVGAGARLWGLSAAVWGARDATCATCGHAGAGLACQQRGCRARSHVPCAHTDQWLLDEEEFKSWCGRHKRKEAAGGGAQA